MQREAVSQRPISRPYREPITINLKSFEETVAVSPVAESMQVARPSQLDLEYSRQRYSVEENLAKGLGERTYLGTYDLTGVSNKLAYRMGIGQITKPKALTETLEKTSTEQKSDVRVLQLPFVSPEVKTDTRTLTATLTNVITIPRTSTKTIVGADVFYAPYQLNQTLYDSIRSSKMPPLPYFDFPSGGGVTGGGRKRYKYFKETFLMGLDLSSPIITPPRGVAPPRLRKTRRPTKVKKRKR